MLEFLYQNRDIFVTEDNPSLGCTDFVQHHIILKQNFRHLHQAPYRLPPDKTEILRHYLGELLEQCVICEVDATEEAPITSPIVLIAKRTKPSENEAGKPIEQPVYVNIVSALTTDFKTTNLKFSNITFQIY